MIGRPDPLVGEVVMHSWALTPGAVMAEMLGKVEGCIHGHGGSMHLSDAQRRLFGGDAIVAGGIPSAVGLALADAMQDHG